MIDMRALIFDAHFADKVGVKQWVLTDKVDVKQWALRLCVRPQ
jgi:hypothetical protein